MITTRWLWLLILGLAPCAACTKPCNPGTVMLTIDLGPAAQGNRIDVSLSLDGGPPQLRSIMHQPGKSIGSIELQFSSAYPAGHLLTISAVVFADNARLGAGTVTLTAGNECQTAAIAIGLDSADLGIPDDAPTPPCVGESDTMLCAQLNKNCEVVQTVDRCSHVRIANCGTCASPTPACLNNVCTTPVCGTSFAAGTPIPGVNNGGNPALQGVSADGTSLLYLQSSPGSCDSAKMVIADRDVTGTFNIQDIGGELYLLGFNVAGQNTGQSFSLNADGLTIIGLAQSGQRVLATTRSAVGKIDFGNATDAPFTALNAQTLASGASVRVQFPLMSRDGLAFYYTLYGAANSADNGFYEATRPSTNVPFSAGTALTGDIQNFISGGSAGITGISSDHLTAFVGLSNFNTAIMVRNSLSQPFMKTSTQMLLIGWRMEPLADCSGVIGTCEPGGCSREQICLYNKM